MNSPSKDASTSSDPRIVRIERFCSIERSSSVPRFARPDPTALGSVWIPRFPAMLLSGFTPKSFALASVALGAVVLPPAGPCDDHQADVLTPWIRRLRLAVHLTATTRTPPRGRGRRRHLRHRPCSSWTPSLDATPFTGGRMAASMMTEQITMLSPVASRTTNDVTEKSAVISRCSSASCKTFSD